MYLKAMGMIGKGGHGCRRMAQHICCLCWLAELEMVLLDLVVIKVLGVEHDS